MDILIIFGTCLIAFLLGVAWRGWASNRSATVEPLPEPLLQGLVHTKDDQSIRGLLIDDYPDYILLKDARYIQGDREVEIEGDVVRVPRANEAWTQLLGAS